jgi:hypothetical protein
LSVELIFWHRIPFLAAKDGAPPQFIPVLPDDMEMLAWACFVIRRLTRAWVVVRDPLRQAAQLCRPVANQRLLQKLPEHG